MGLQVIPKVWGTRSGNTAKEIFGKSLLKYYVIFYTFYFCLSTAGLSTIGFSLFYLAYLTKNRETAILFYLNAYYTPNFLYFYTNSFQYNLLVKYNFYYKTFLG